MSFRKSKSAAPVPTTDPLINVAREYVTERRSATTLYESLVSRVSPDAEDGSYGTMAANILAKMRQEQEVLEEAVNGPEPDSFIVKSLALLQLGGIPSYDHSNLTDMERKAGAYILGAGIGSALSSPANPSYPRLEVHEQLPDGTAVAQSVDIERMLPEMPFLITTWKLSAEVAEPEVFLLNGSAENAALTHVSGTGLSAPVRVATLLETRDFAAQQLLVAT